jgi:folate-dependent tRNA-U54 methylase TrmFO/GidA
MKANFGILPPLASTSKAGKRERGTAYAERARNDMNKLLEQNERIASGFRR